MFGCKLSAFVTLAFSAFGHRIKNDAVRLNFKYCVCELNELYLEQVVADEQDFIKLYTH